MLSWPSEPLKEGEDYVMVQDAGWCAWAYRIIYARVIHNLGYTDAILARVNLPMVRPGHKSGLQPMGRQMEEIYRLYSAVPGAYRRAVEDGKAAEWMAENLDTIEIIERKIYNRHHLLENLRLALHSPLRIEP